MITGVSTPSTNGFNFVNRAKPNATATAKPSKEAQDEAREIQPLGSDDPAKLAREFSLLSLAARGFENLLPNIEMLTTPVE